VVLGLGLFFFQLPAINVPAFATSLLILAIFGIELGVLLLGINYFFGNEAFVITFAISDVISVLSAVFFPLAVLPGPIQALAAFLPSTHAFSLIKSSYGIEPFDPLLAVATLLLWGILAAAANRWLYNKARKQGKLLKLK